MSNNTKISRSVSVVIHKTAVLPSLCAFESDVGALKCKRRPFFRQLPFTGKKAKHLGNSIFRFSRSQHSDLSLLICQFHTRLSNFA